MPVYVLRVFSFVECRYYTDILDDIDKLLSYASDHFQINSSDCMKLMEGESITIYCSDSNRYMHELRLVYVGETSK